MLDAYEARVVRLVLENPGTTRNDLSEALRSSIATTTTIAKTLVTRGVLEEGGAAPSTGGRRAARLVVRPGWGHTFAHQTICGRLFSTVMDARGNILSRVDRPISDVPSLFRAVDAAEMELSVKVPDGPALASAIVVPGSADRAENVGNAPWMFGHEIIDPKSAGNQSLIISSAGCHTAWLEMREGVRFNGPWVSVDVVDGLSGLLLTKRSEAVPLDLNCLDPDDSLIMRCALEARIVDFAKRRGNSLAKRLTDAKDVMASLGFCSEAGNPAANRVIDGLVEQTCDFIQLACRALSPKRLLVSSHVLDRGLGAQDLLRAALHRRAGFPKDGIHLADPSTAVEMRFTGAALAALNIRLRSMEDARPKR